MLIIREVLTAKPGPASRLAKLFKKIFGSDPNPENVFMRLTVSVTGGWGEKGSETENCHSWEKNPKNAQTPCRPAGSALVFFQGARCVGQHLRKSPLVETKIETTKNRSAKKSRKNHGSHII